MRITRAETMIVEIPFAFPGSGHGIMPTAWRSLEFALVRLEDDAGNIGWGEGFGYFTVDATKALIDRLLLPGLIGGDVEDIAAWNRSAQRRLNLFGRTGPAIYALSGVDIALWDLAAKRAGRPLCDLLGTDGAHASDLPCYASLMRYADEGLATTACVEALARGFTSIKLHETDLGIIESCRDVVGPSVPLSVDVNCAWSTELVSRERGRLDALELAWLEEPVFPPEDFAALAQTRCATLPIAAGENWGPAFQFHAAGGCVDIFQPSITKVGGVSEYLRVLQLAAATSVTTIPHCPYFGPGLFATIHLAAATGSAELLEFLYVDPEAWLTDIPGLRQGDRLLVPQAPGLGFDPDPATLARYRRA
jgi:L-alanine-DL-glutamate epimerase-like enolase superfamily enzyme